MHGTGPPILENKYSNSPDIKYSLRFLIDDTVDFGHDVWPYVVLKKINLIYFVLNCLIIKETLIMKVIILKVNRVIYLKNEGNNFIFYCFFVCVDFRG